MQDFEKLGVFYLGRIFDLKANSRSDQLVLYNSKDLVTHGVCVGMTGSGKTGLCISLLEEAALDSVPSIVIDPKGDLTNLLLTFPNLSREEFLPWVNEEDLLKAGATKKGRQTLAEKTGISETLILEWVNLSDLFRIKGVGEEYSDLLEEAGVDTVVELAKRVPENLHAKMLEVNEEKKLVRQPPGVKQVQDWVAQAKKLQRKVEY